MYRVIEAFEDAADRRHPYEEGDTYPREGFDPGEDRIRALSGKDNARRRPVIMEEAKPAKGRK